MPSKLAYLSLKTSNRYMLGTIYHSWVLMYLPRLAELSFNIIIPGQSNLAIQMMWKYWYSRGTKSRTA